jgi:hypothetical protein
VASFFQSVHGIRKKQQLFRFSLRKTDKDTVHGILKMFDSENSQNWQNVLIAYHPKMQSFTTVFERIKYYRQLAYFFRQIAHFTCERLDPVNIYKNLNFTN